MAAALPLPPPLLLLCCGSREVKGNDIVLLNDADAPEALACLETALLALELALALPQALRSAVRLAELTALAIEGEGTSKTLALATPVALALALELCVSQGRSVE